MAGYDRRVRAMIRWVRKRLAVLICLILCIAALLAWLSRSLPRRALAELGRLTHTHITAHDVTTDRGGRIHIRDLSVKPLAGAVHDNTLLRAQEVTVAFTWSSLWKRRPRIEEVNVRNFTCNLIYDPHAGTWNTQSLTCPPTGKGVGVLPTIHLENGSVRYLRLENQVPRPVMTVPIDVAMRPDTVQAHTLAFTLKTGPLAPGFGTSDLQGRWRPGELTLVGGVSNRDLPGQQRTWSIPQVALELTYDPQGNYRMRFHADQIQARHTPHAFALDWLTPVLSDTSRALTRLRGFIEEFRPAGRANLDLTLQGQCRALLTSQMTATLTCLDASICDQDFPYLLEHLKGDVQFTHTGLVSTGLEGVHGDTAVHLDFRVQGFGAAWTYEVHMACDAMPLDADLYQALSPRYQVLWDRLNPSGIVAMDNRQARHSATHKTRLLRIRPLDAQAAYRDFPYPLERLTGELRFENNRATLDNLTAQRGDSRMVVNGTVALPKDAPPVIDVTIEAQGIPFDEALAQALPESQRDTYRRLQLHGQTEARIHVYSPPDVNRPATYQADLTAQGVHVNAPGWRTALTDVAMQVSVTPTELTIASLTARSGHSPVHIEGPIRFGTPGASPDYQLTVQSDAFAVEDLVAGLPPRARQSLAGLHAQGPVQLTGTLCPLPETTDPNYSFVLHCQQNRVQPQAWPYPLRDITGTIRVDNRRVLLENLRGVPDVNNADPLACLTLAGALDYQTGYCTDANLVVAAHAIPLDANFVTALPPSLRPTMEPLAPTGTLSIEPSRVTLHDLTLHRHLTLHSRWHMESGQLKLRGRPVDLNDVTADIELSHETDKGFQAGQVALTVDRFSMQGKAATQLRTTLCYDGQQEAWVADEIRGNFYGGTLLGDLRAQWLTGNSHNLQMRLGFHNIDLYRFLLACRATRPAPGEPSQGNLSGNLSLGLQPGEAIDCIGQCTLTIQDMKVGTRSPLAQVLNRVRGYDTDDIHFDRMFVEAYLQQQRIQFQRFDISGRSLALQGTGVWDLDTERIHLDLITRGQRPPTSDPTVLQSLSEGLGGAVMRLEVTGDPMHPVVNTRTLPVIEDSLRILGTRP